MYKIIKKTIFLFALLVFTLVSNAQVGINTESPNKLTDLDVKNIVTGADTIPKGIMIPRMTEAQRNKIVVTDKDMANSLLIYNIDEDCYNYYSKTDAEWKSLCGKLGKAKFDFKCSSIEVNGTYIEKKELTNGNYLKIAVDVTKPGDYEITGRSTNGYFFHVTGQFLSEGRFTIYATGQGTPQKIGTDIITLTNNGEQVICEPQLTIPVLSTAGNFTLNCNASIVNGIYEVGKPVNSTHSIVLNVNVSTIGSYSITSDVVDGLSFSGSGTLTSIGSQPITLYASGTPTSSSIKTITFTTNSTGGTAVSCSARIRMTIPRKTILSLGSEGWAVHSASGIALMFQNKYNFGTEQTSTFKAYTPIIKSSAATAITSAILQPYLAPVNGDKPVDIVIMTYNADLYLPAASAMMAEYVKNGGVLIMLNEHNKEQVANFNFITSLFDDAAITGTDNVVAAGTVVKLPNVNDEVLNGPFGDVRGKYIGEDQGYGDVFTYLPAGELDWSVSSLDYSGTGGSASQVFAFKAKNYNLFWCGDGGFAAAAVGNTNAIAIPALMSASPNYLPLPKPNYGRGTVKKTIDNAVLMANLLAWALQQAEYDGINTK